MTHILNLFFRFLQSWKIHFFHWDFSLRDLWKKINVSPEKLWITLNNKLDRLHNELEKIQQIAELQGILIKFFNCSVRR